MTFIFVALMDAIGKRIVVAEKTKGIYKELITIGVAKDSNEIDSLVNAGHEWIFKEESRRHPQPEF